MYPSFAEPKEIPLSYLNLKKLKFYVDHMLGSGSNVLIIWLAILSFGFVLTVSFVTWVLGISDHREFGSLLWDLTMRALTPWEIEASMGSGPYLFVLLILTLFGIFVLSILISLLSAIIDERIREVAQGVQPFPFNGHLVLLGWSSRVPSIVEELVVANASESESRLLIVSGLLHDELGECVKRDLSDLGNIQLFFRSRKLDSESTFANINLLGARRVIVLGDEHSSSQQLNRLKTSISVYNYFDQLGVSPPEVLVEVDCEKERQSVLRGSGRRAITANLSHLPARLIVETIFQPHLPSIFDEILSFSGSEIYVVARLGELGLDDLEFHQISKCVQGAITLGILSSCGHVSINPPVTLTFSKGDRLIVLAEDDSAISVLAPDRQFFDAESRAKMAVRAPPEKDAGVKSVLLLGASPSTPAIIQSLSRNPRCSILQVTKAKSDLEADMQTFVESNQIPWITGEFDDAEFLSTLNIDQFDSVVITNAYKDSDPSADLEVIRTILLLTDDESKKPFPHLIAELNAPDSRDMMARLVDLDFVVSDKIGSKIFAQYAENPHLINVIDALICSGQHRIGLLPINQADEKFVSFETLRSRFSVLGIVIGVRYVEQGTPCTKLNPRFDLEIPVDATDVELIYVE